MPCPMIVMPHRAQRGASLWIAHANVSNAWRVSPTTTSNALSYSLPQHSQRFMGGVWVQPMFRDAARADEVAGTTLATPTRPATTDEEGYTP